MFAHPGNILNSLVCFSVFMFFLSTVGSVIAERKGRSTLSLVFTVLGIVYVLGLLAFLYPR